MISCSILYHYLAERNRFGVYASIKKPFGFIKHRKATEEKREHWREQISREESEILQEAAFYHFQIKRHNFYTLKCYRYETN